MICSVRSWRKIHNKVTKDRLTLQFNGNHTTAARRSCQGWRSRGRQGRVPVLSRCSVELLATAFQGSCLAGNSMCDADVRWDLFTGHTLCIWFPSSRFHKQCVSDMRNRREEQIQFLCVSAFIFHPKMMEVNAGSLVWEHSTGVWGAGGRWFYCGKIWVSSLLITESAA